ncbi:MAG: pseudouridine synthase [Bacteroidales bacterium]|nr:pseudouridine synthase [Bacteroidales bacterium]
MQQRPNKKTDSGDRKTARPQDRKTGRPQDRKTDRGNAGKSYNDEKPRRGFGARKEYGNNTDRFEDRKPRRTSRSFDDKPHDDDKPRRGFGARKEYGNDTDRFEDRKPRRTSRSFDDKPHDDDNPRRGFGARKEYGNDTDRFEDRKPRRTSRSFDDKPHNDDKPRRSFGARKEYGNDTDKFEDRKPRRTSRSFDDKPHDDDKPRRGFGARKEYGNDTDRFEDRKPRRTSRSFDDDFQEDRKPRRASRSFDDRPHDDEKPRRGGARKEHNAEIKGAIRLNRYIARSGICSRREADELIATGEVKVNGALVTEMGVKVTKEDRVHVSDQLISFERPVYLLLNKPKGYITTTDDPQKRKTVMELVGRACKENILPVGRLDRNTTGVLLFTNDGDMAKKLTHPSGNIRKVYHIHLDKVLTNRDMQEIAGGIELDDGFIKPDVITYVGNGDDKKEIGMELHSGRNRIVRRIFEQLGYEVVKLDRVIFANLTKKDVKRGHHRFLTEQEVAWLKML